MRVLVDKPINCRRYIRIDKPSRLLLSTGSSAFLFALRPAAATLYLSLLGSGLTRTVGFDASGFGGRKPASASRSSLGGGFTSVIRTYALSDKDNRQTIWLVKNDVPSSCLVIAFDWDATVGPVRSARGLAFCRRFSASMSAGGAVDANP